MTRIAETVVDAERLCNAARAIAFGKGLASEATSLIQTGFPTLDADQAASALLGGVCYVDGLPFILTRPQIIK
jgi:hypothetical protein